MPVKRHKHSTRSAILRLIKIKGPAAIQQISRALGITSVAVRRHVHLLENAGLVAAQRERRPRGRPADLLRLTEGGDNLFPKAYDRFSLELLQTLAAQDGPAKVERLFQDRKDHMVARYSWRMVGLGREARVREAVRILSAEGYMAESRRINANAYRITEHNCPIAQVARQFPQTCLAELCFLAEALGAEVQREAHILKGNSQCSYLVQFPTSPRVGDNNDFLRADTGRSRAP